MTKKDLMTALRGLPNNTQIVIKGLSTNWYLKAIKISVDKRARVKKIVLESNIHSIIGETRLLDRATIVYDETK